jgi:hypothetical protein
VFEIKVLRRIFQPKRDEVTGEWRKLHSKELRNTISDTIQGIRQLAVNEKKNNASHN